MQRTTRIWKIPLLFCISSFALCLAPVMGQSEQTATEAVVTVSTSVSSEGGLTAEESVNEFNNEHFDAPQRLMVGDTPLNTQARQMYPSPAMFDVDGDGQVELVVGDIFGSLNVYENENQARQGDPVWSPHVALKSTDGQPIKVSNW